MHFQPEYLRLVTIIPVQRSGSICRSLEAHTNFPDFRSFYILGSVTMAWAIAVFFLLPDSPVCHLLTMRAILIRDLGVCAFLQS